MKRFPIYKLKKPKVQENVHSIQPLSAKEGEHTLNSIKII